MAALVSYLSHISPSLPPEGLDVDAVIFLKPAVPEAEEVALTVPPTDRLVPSKVRLEDPANTPELLNCT